MNAPEHAAAGPVYRPCQACGEMGPTATVTFRKNIGALVVRFSNEIKGALCKKCVNKYFWSWTLTTLVVGWWGVISFFITPFNIISNIVAYIGAQSALRETA